MGVWGVAPAEPENFGVGAGGLRYCDVGEFFGWMPKCLKSHHLMKSLFKESFFGAQNVIFVLKIL